MRLLVVHHMLPDRELMLRAFAPDMPAVRRLVGRAMFPLLRPRLAAGFGIDELSVERAFEKIRAAGERFRAELRPSGYLGGDAFTRRRPDAGGARGAGGRAGAVPLSAAPARPPAPGAGARGAGRGRDPRLDAGDVRAPPGPVGGDQPCHVTNVTQPTGL